MKKRFTLFMLVAFCISLATMARNTVVSSSAEFGNAWGALTDGDTISFAPGLMNIGNRTLPATGGTFTFRSQYDHPDSMAIVQLQ
ncbi:MAG TPA: hypothetical protein PKO00_01270, partial [Bacteroidales bacterium]|nr:hypothetical protein [Bacteroidales bacterium]